MKLKMIDFSGYTYDVDLIVDNNLFQYHDIYVINMGKNIFRLMNHGEIIYVNLKNITYMSIKSIKPIT